jgi:hypothetical protein
MLTGGQSKIEENKQACLDELTRLADKYSGINRRFMYELYIARKL